MNRGFHTEQQYSLQLEAYFAIFQIPGKISISRDGEYLGPKIWYILPDDYKTIGNSDTFKIKKWKPENCPCRLCKVYIDTVGFLGKN